MKLSAWIVEWDLEDGLAELTQQSDLFDEVHIFAASFEPDDQVQLADVWQQALPALDSWRKATGGTVWLTVVNDSRVASGQRKLKDPDLVHRLIESPSSRLRHSRDLLAMAEATRVEGVEVDYENLHPEDWEAFGEFAEVLYRRAQAKKLHVTVVGEPKYASRQREISPEIPQTIMAYNLHGPDSLPGPKTTPAFIRQLAEELFLPNSERNFRLALPTGGFEWVHGKSRARAVTWEDASTIRKVTNGELRKTSDGHDSQFSYVDEDGNSHEIWFQTAESIAAQWGAASQVGFRELAIWRLGGNEEALFRLLRDTKAKGRIL